MLLSQRLSSLAAFVVCVAGAALCAVSAAQSPNLCVRYGDPAMSGANPDCGSGATQVQVTVGTSPSGASFSVDGTTYTSTQQFTWTVNDTHTIAVTSPQTSSGTEYTFSSWSDAGAASHTVTASSSTSSYTASFSTSYQLNIAANNSSHGSFTPASGSYYAAGAVVSIKATPASGYAFENWSGSSDIASTTSASTTITMNAAESITANFKSSGGGIQYFGGTVDLVVTTNADDDTPTPSNCPPGGPTGDTGLNCSLRDALAAAGAGQTDISFSSSVFSTSNTSAQNTIALQYGSLQIPAETTINGLITPNTNHPNVVTIDGGQQFTVFWISSGQTAVELDNLDIADGYNTFGGGGIYNDGALTLNNCMLAGNAAPGGQGGGILNDIDGALTLENSTVSGGSAATGGGIANFGTLIMTESTLSGNSATSDAGGLYQDGVATIASSTISANQSSGSVGGVEIALVQPTVVENSIVAGNNAATVPPDIVGSYTDNGGNQVATYVNLAPLGNYGGPTQTQIPLPWSPAVCTGLASNIPAIVMTDQRGLPNQNVAYPGYSGTSPCVDSGAVQTNYSLAFTAPPAPVAPATSILVNTPFTAAVTVEESGSPFNVPLTVSLTLTGTGTLTGGSAATSNGVATYPALQVSAAGNGDTLTASLALNPPSSPAPLTISAASSGFDVTSMATSTTAANATAAFTGTAQSIPLSATVNAGSETVNAGTVTFTVMNGSNPIGSPVTSAAITAGIAGVSYILPAATPAGVYTISAVYNAGGAFTASSDARHTLTISQAASAVALSSSTGNANLNASVTFTATVTGNATVTPTGAVVFYDGSAILGSEPLNGQGMAAYSTSGLAAGVHLVTAVYSGDSDFAGSTSGVYAQTVTAPDFTIAANPSTLTLSAGQAGQVTFTFTPLGGYSGTVTFSCSGLPSNAGCIFSPSSLTANGSNTAQTTQMTITTAGTASGTLAQNAPPAGFESARLLFLPALACGILLAWQRRRLRRSGGWLALAFLALAAYGICACGSSSPPSTVPGTYTLFVSASGGSGGGPSHTSAFTLTINE